MKNLLSVLLMAMGLLMCQAVYAQDTITMKTGDAINGKVLKVGTTEIEYKKSDNLEGPSYSVAKKDVYMIKYENGSTDMFSAPRDLEKEKAERMRQAEEEAAEDRQQWQLDYEYSMERYRGRLTSGIICTSIGASCLITGSTLLGIGIPRAMYDIENVNPRLNTTAMAVSGALLVIGSIPLTIVGPIQIGKAFNAKKRAMDAKSHISFVPSVTPANGITGTQTGMAMRITF